MESCQVEWNFLYSIVNEQFSGWKRRFVCARGCGCFLFGEEAFSNMQSLLKCSLGCSQSSDDDSANEFQENSRKANRHSNKYMEIAPGM